MSRHLVLVSDSEFENIISGKAEYLIKFFKKRFDSLNSLKKGDLVYLRQKDGGVIARFNAGKIILVDGVATRDWSWIKEMGNGKRAFRKEVFETKALENSILVIVQIEKLEQLITSPIEIDKRSKKEWMILD